MPNGGLQNLTPEQRRENLKKAHAARKANALIQPRFNVWRAIRLKCLDCSQSLPEIEKCDITDCSLWEFRFGRKPTKEMVDQVKDIPVWGVKNF
jgi:hypothetical protein